MKHKKLYMASNFYESAKQAPNLGYSFNRISSEGWLQIFSHMWAHENGGPSSSDYHKGWMAADLQEHDLTYALREFAHHYSDGTGNHDFFHPEERGLMKKARLVVAECDEDFIMVSANKPTEAARWKLVMKPSQKNLLANVS